MKVIKYNLFITLFLFICIHVCAQVEQNPLYLKNYAPSPEAYSMMQYEEIPVSLYTGIPDISVPLYNIRSNDWTLPIALSYHASGIKISQEASWVGLGWNLQAGGMISRSIRGKDDLNQFLTDTNPVPDADNIPNNFLSFHAINGNILIPEMNKDVEPDVFFYNFAGYSGKFYSKKGANIKGHGENLFELSDPEAHLLIRLKNSKNNPIFEIIAPGNIKYTFKAIEITKRHALGFFDRSVDLECPHFTSQHYIPDTFDFNPEYTITSWYLTHIQYPTGDEIFFDYHRALNTYLSPMHRSDVTNHVVDVKDLKNPYYPIEDINHFTIENEPKKQSTISFEYIYEQPRLTGIRWTEGELEFVPAEKNREDIRTLPHAETEGAKMLGQINLYTKDRKKKLKSFLFHYSYFLSMDDNGNLQKIPNYNTSRLKLDSISIKGTDSNKTQKYKMGYNDSEPLPIKNCYAYDYWGYYNESNMTIPFVPYVSSSDYRSMSLSIDESTKKYTLARDGKIVMEKGKKINGYGEDKEPSSKALIGTLTSLTTPLEGKTEFKYEGNRVIDSTQIEWKIQDSLSIDIYALKEYDNTSLTTTFSMPYDGCIDINWVYDGNIDCIEKEKNTTLINIPGITSIVGIPQDTYNSGSPIHGQYHLKQRTACPKGTHTITLKTSDRAKLSVIIKRYKAKLGYYEPLVGGIRIAEIKSPLTTRKYYYTNDKGECSGRLNRKPVFNRMVNRNYFATYSNGIPIANILYIEFNSAAIQPLENPYNSYFMGYEQVNIIQQTKDDKTIIEKNYFHNEKEDHNEFYIDYPGRNMPLNGKLIKRRIYSGDNLLSQNIKKYKAIKVSDIKGLKYYPNDLSHNYHIENYCTQLIEETDTIYTKLSNTFVVHPVKKTYAYNSNYLLSRMIIRENDCIKSHFIRYATDFINPYLDGYFEKYNLITTPIEEDFFTNGILSKKLWHIHYKDLLVKPWKEYIFYNRPGVIIPSFNGNTSIYTGKPDITYNSYNKRGRNTSLHTRMGQSVVLVWGYKHQHIIAQISNATIAEVENKGIDIEALADKEEPTETDWDLLHSLREALPQGRIIITRYEPLIGIISQTGPTGVTVRYTYDEFGRLSETIETGKRENVIQKNEYKYATEK